MKLNCITPRLGGGGGGGELLSQPHHCKGRAASARGEMGRTPTRFPQKLDGAFDSGFLICFFNLKLE